MSDDQRGSPTAPIPDRIVTVTGGAGGQAVVLDDLRTLAQFFATSAAKAAAEAVRCQSYATSPDLALSAALSPGTAWQAESAILAVASGPGGALRTAVRLTALAVKMEASASAYEQTEAANAALWYAIDSSAGFLAGRAVIPIAIGGAVVGAVGTMGLGVVAVSNPQVGGPLLAFAGSVGARLASPDAVAAMGRFATEHPELVSHLANGSGGLFAGVQSAVLAPFGTAAGLVGSTVPTSTEQSAALLALLFHPGRFRTERAKVQPEPPGAPESAADLASLLLAEGRPPGAMDVLTLTTRLADGSTRTSYVVLITGTDDWSLPPAQRETTFSRDLGSNLQLVGGIETPYTKAIPEALAQAGVPAGAAIALVGHSQGGLIAMQAAASRTVRARYNVTDVVTMASPVATMARPPGTRVLSLENTKDIVHQADGAQNPDRPWHTTVVFEDDQPTAKEVRDGKTEAKNPAGFNHSMGRYLHGAQMVDRRAAADDPTLTPAINGLMGRGYLAADKDQVSVQLTQIVVSVTR